MHPTGLSGVNAGHRTRSVPTSITSALDPELVGEVLDVLRQLRLEGMTMVLATHEASSKLTIGLKQIDVVGSHIVLRHIYNRSIQRGFAMMIRATCFDFGLLGHECFTDSLFFPCQS